MSYFSIFCWKDKPYLQQCQFPEETAGKSLDKRLDTLVFFSFLKDRPDRDTYTNTVYSITRHQQNLQINIKAHFSRIHVMSTEKKKNKSHTHTTFTTMNKRHTSTHLKMSFTTKNIEQCWAQAFGWNTKKHKYYLWSIKLCCSR